MKTSHAVLLASCLGLALALECALGRTLLQDAMQAADLSGCPEAPGNSVDPPPGSQMTWEASASGTRNWTCMAGKLEFFGAVATFADGGSGYYTPPMPDEMAGLVGYWVVDLTKAGMYYMDTLKNSTVPVAGALASARWPVAKMSNGAQPCDYLTRTETTGGATPPDCGSTAEGGVLTIPYTAVYKCYACA